MESDAKPDVTGAARSWRRRVVALAAPLLAAVLAKLLWRHIEPHVWFLFYPAVFVSSWLGGRRLGLLAIVLSAVLVWWLFLPPGMTFAIFVATGALFVVFNDRLARATATVAAQEQLAADLRAMTELNEVGALFLSERRHREPVFQKIIDAAIEIAHADGGSVQLLDPDSADLKLVAQRGSSQGRAVRSTPIVTRDGRSVGMFSTHHKTPYRPDARELRLLDLLARQAADIVDVWETNQQRGAALEAAHSANQRLDELANERRIFEALIVNSSDFIGIADPIGRPTYVNPAGRRMVGLSADHPIEDTEIASYYPPEQRAFARDVILKGMLEEGHWEGETFFRNWQTEEAIPVSDRHFVITDPSSGEILGMATITRDISDLRRVQNALERTNEELAEAREFLVSVLESSTEYSIIAKDLERRVVGWNAGAARSYGYTAAEIVGKSSDAFYLAEDVESGRVASLHKRALDYGHATALFRRRRKDGSLFLARVVTTRRNDLHGNAIGYVTVTHDVTAEQRQIEQQRFLAEVGETLQTSLDWDATCERTARLVLDFMGDLCAFDAIEGDGRVHRMKVSHGEEAAPAAVEALERLSPGGPHFQFVLTTREPLVIPSLSENTVDTSDAYLRVLRAQGVRSLMLIPLVTRDRLMAVVSIMSCRPDRRYGREDLRLGTELARRAALALDNARLYEVAQEAIRVRDRVLGVVAHDLRNPLGVILVQASLVRKRGAAPSSQAMDRIERGATRMNRLIQDLLDVTRMEGGQLLIDRTQISPERVLRESVEAQKALATSASIDLTVDLKDALPEIWADHDRMLQVFENLVGNAIKFTAPGGHVAIGAAPSSGEVVFWVRDTGVGISAEDIPHLFDRFWQAKHEGSRSTGGAGLGLQIVKGIVEAHGGRIWVESAPGEGSVFYFSIPSAPGAGAVQADR